MTTQKKSKVSKDQIWKISRLKKLKFDLFASSIPTLSCKITTFHNAISLNPLHIYLPCKKWPVHNKEHFRIRQTCKNELGPLIALKVNSILGGTIPCCKNFSWQKTAEPIHMIFCKCYQNSFRQLLTQISWP